MENINRDISDIKTAMIAHNKADDERFDKQDTKLDVIITSQHEFRETQLVNHEVIKGIKTDTGKTNGRVTALEDVVKRLEANDAKLTQIVSFHHNQYESFVKQQEALGKDFVTKLEFNPIKSRVEGTVNIVMVLVITAIVGLVLIK